MATFRMAKARQLRPAPVPEKAEQAHGVQLLRSIGAEVFVSGTTRRRGDFHGTMQTPGIPDVEAWLPARSDRPVTLLKWECKADGGRLRPEQQRYRELCEAARVAHVVGPFDALIAWLAERGFVRADSFPHYRQPRSKA